MALTGDLAETPFTDLVQFYCTRRERVALIVTTGAGEGVFHIDGGEVVDARFGALNGTEAVRAALGLKEGSFRVDRNVVPPPRTIFESWNKLLFDEMLRRDQEADPKRSPVTADALFDELSLPEKEESVKTTQALRRCPVCSREFAEGSKCPDDGATLIARIDPGARATPAMGNVAVAAAPTPARSTTPPVRLHSTPQNVPWNAAAASASPASNPGRPSSPQQRPPSTPPGPGRSSPPPPPPNERAPKKGGTLVVLIAAAVVVVAAVLGGALYLRSQKGTAESALPSTPAATRSPAQAPQSARSAVNGVTDTEVIFGMSAPLNGPSKELGRQMKTGVEIAFAAANDAGGVHGRKLTLIALDDGYEPSRAIETMKELAEKRKVLGFIGNVGTPTAAVAAPYAVDKKMLFFGAFTGANLLRKDPPDRYVFNYRASYAEETAATVKYLVEIRRIKPAEIAVFAQEDSFGDAGFEGVAKAMRQRYRRDPSKILRVGFKRNTIEVNDAVAEILKQGPKVKAVVMVGTYRPCAKFIEKLKDKGADLIFTDVSFVGSTALSEELMQVGGKYADGVIVTQVIPLPQSKSTAVLKYQELLQKYAPGEKPDFVSLEGYIAANLLIEGLKRAGRDLNTETLVNALEALRGLDLGIGAPLNFGLSEHQASHKVWGTVMDSTGAFRVFEME